MRRIRRAGTVRMAVAAAVVVAAGVGGGASSSAKSARAAAGSTVDWYSSLPLVGSSSAQTGPAVNGIKLALRLEPANKAGQLHNQGHVRWTTPPALGRPGGTGRSDLRQDARKAATDPNAAVY